MMRLALLSTAAAWMAAAVGVFVSVIDCSAFDSTTAAVVSPTDAAASEATVSDAVAATDVGGDVVATPDAGCVGEFVDDFARASPAGGPWDLFNVQLGDAGGAAIDSDGGNNLFGVYFLAKNQPMRRATLERTFPQNTRSIDVRFTQHELGVAGGGTPPWAAELVTIEADTQVVGLALVNVPMPILYVATDAGIVGTVGVPLQSSTNVHLSARFGGDGGITSDIGGVQQSVPFATSPNGVRRLRLGLAISGGGAPTIYVSFSHVTVCWR